MYLSAEQILAARSVRTVEVDVPEWGEGAKVIVGVMGGLAKARLNDWMDGIGREPPAVEPDEDEVVSCDSPEPVVTGRVTAARVEQLEDCLRHLIRAVRKGRSKEKIDALLTGADEVLASKGPDKIYSKEEDYQFTLRWCLATILDPATKEPAFTLAQLESLGRLDPAPLFRIAAAAQELNLATKDSREDVEKNSGPTSGGSSGSD